MKARHLSGPALLLVIAAGAVACAKDEERSARWVCSSSDVPMGERVQCTQSALIIDESAGAGDSCSGALDNPEGCTVGGSVPGTIGDVPDGPTYECNAGEAGCPPEDATGGADGTPPPSDSDGTSQGGSSVPEGSSGTGTSSGGSSSGGPGNGNGKNSDFGGSSGPDECAYVPELPYCGGAGGDGSSQGGSSDCTKNNCDAPGQQKKAGDSGGASSSSGGASSGGASSSSGSASGKGKAKRHYTCTKDQKGNRSCVCAPECAPGTHASACGACVADGDSGDCVPPADGGCWVTGGGFVVAPNLTSGAAADGHDNFGGNAKPMKDGRIQGHWNHVDHGTGNHAKGKPEYIVCRHVDEPGPGQPGGKKGFTMNQVYFGGPAEWRSNGAWATGYWFDVVAKDHGEPGSKPHAKNGGMPDTYHFTIRKMDDPAKQVSGATVYETKGELEGGNIQMHPPNGGHPYTPMSLPGWVGFEP